MIRGMINSSSSLSFCEIYTTNKKKTRTVMFDDI